MKAGRRKADRPLSIAARTNLARRYISLSEENSTTSAVLAPEPSIACVAYTTVALHPSGETSGSTAPVTSWVRLCIPPIVCSAAYLATAPVQLPWRTLSRQHLLARAALRPIGRRRRKNFLTLHRSPVTICWRPPSRGYFPPVAGIGCTNCSVDSQRKPTSRFSNILP
jgi:hypothetical protein